MKQALGLKASDAIIGFMYLGTPAAAAAPASKPDAAGFVRDWTG